MGKRENLRFPKEVVVKSISRMDHPHVTPAPTFHPSPTRANHNPRVHLTYKYIYVTHLSPIFHVFSVDCGSAVLCLASSSIQPILRHGLY